MVGIRKWVGFCDDDEEEEEFLRGWILDRVSSLLWAESAVFTVWTSDGGVINAIVCRVGGA